MTSKNINCSDKSPKLHLIFGDNGKQRLVLSNYRQNNQNVGQTRTWVDFEDENESIEKIEYPVPVQGE